MREAKEEIGLDPSLVNAVTVLEPFVNKVHQGCATPFLCLSFFFFFQWLMHIY